MSIAALVRNMAAAGATPDLIAMAVEAVENAGAAIEQQRAAARSRKQRQRERERDSHVTVTGQSQDETPAPSPFLPPDPQLTPIHTPVENTRTRKGLAWPVPDGVDPDHWRDLLANRKSKRLTNTPTALRQLLAALAELSDDEWPPGRIIEFAAGRGWGAIFDPRKHEHRNAQRTGNFGRPANDHPGGKHGAAAARLFDGMG
jgi:hypothetical protein